MAINEVWTAGEGSAVSVEHPAYAPKTNEIVGVNGDTNVYAVLDIEDGSLKREFGSLTQYLADSLTDRETGRVIFAHNDGGPMRIDTVDTETDTVTEQLQISTPVDCLFVDDGYLYASGDGGYLSKYNIEDFSREWTAGNPYGGGHIYSGGVIPDTGDVVVTGRDSAKNEHDAFLIDGSSGELLDAAQTSLIRYKTKGGQLGKGDSVYIFDTDQGSHYKQQGDSISLETNYNFGFAGVKEYKDYLIGVRGNEEAIVYNPITNETEDLAPIDWSRNATLIEGGKFVDMAIRSGPTYYTTDVPVGFEISGDVVNAEGVAIEEAEVSIQGSDSSTLTDNAGAYSLYRKDGQYTVEVFKQGYFSNSADVTIAGAGVEGLDFGLAEADLSGNVVDYQGNPVDSVEVEMVRNGSVVDSASPSNGEYSFDGSLKKDTTHTIRVNDSSREYFEDSYEIDVNNSAFTGVNFVLDTYFSLEFTLTDNRTGEKASNVNVNVPAESRQASSDNTGKDGSVSIKAGTRFSGGVQVNIGKGDKRYMTMASIADPSNGDHSESVTLFRRTNIGNTV